MFHFITILIASWHLIQTKLLLLYHLKIQITKLNQQKLQKCIIKYTNSYNIHSSFIFSFNNHLKNNHIKLQPLLRLTININPSTKPHLMKTNLTSVVCKILLTL